MSASDPVKIEKKMPETVNYDNFVLIPSNLDRSPAGVIHSAPLIYP
jgi:hypothetical protein